MHPPPSAWQLSPEGTLGGRMGCLGTSVALLVGVGGGTHAEAAQAVLGGGGCGSAKRHHRPLLPAGVAVGKQGLRFPLTLTG